MNDGSGSRRPWGMGRQVSEQSSGSGAITEMLGQQDNEELIVNSIEEIEIRSDIAHAILSCWKAFNRTGSRDQLSPSGHLFISNWFAADPEVAALFSTSKTNHANRFMQKMKDLLDLLEYPGELRTAVETLGFQHMMFEITVERYQIFSRVLMEEMERVLGDIFGAKAQEGLHTFLNYVGSSLIFVRTEYGSRVRIVEESWAQANAKDDGASDHGASPGASPGGSGSGEAEKHSNEGASNDGASDGASDGKFKTLAKNEAMPTTFEDMFHINAAVMRLSKTSLDWMTDVMDSFEVLVSSVSDFNRLYEECDILVLKLAQHPEDTVDLPQFKACMLAALRSLLPKFWTSAHEEAWGWLWEMISKQLTNNLGKPKYYEEQFCSYLDRMEEYSRFKFRKDIYFAFFELAPLGQEYFKQSNTRLHFIAERVLTMSSDIYLRPKRLVSEISALGLRHVGFGIPTELFPPFVTACVKVLGTLAGDEQDVVDGFRWSLTLISKILVRTILDGSTLVMKAINANSMKQLRKALAQAPRKSRATWLLRVQVGDQAISPLSWAIESGSLTVAEIIIKDLLTIRADRARYYYGVDDLYSRHPDIVKRLCDDCPMLVPPLLDGLIWRSHRVQDGQRRVNYYMKHLTIAHDGWFSDALECISASGDPALVSHPIVALLADTLWSGVVVRQFIVSRMWNVFSLLIFIMSQEVLPSMVDTYDSIELSYLLFAARLFGYLVGMGRLAAFQLSRIYVWCRRTMRRIIKEIDTDGNGEIDYEEMKEALNRFKDTVRDEVKKAIRALREDEGGGSQEASKKAIANREKNMYNLISFSLMSLLALMCTHEPTFWCSTDPDWPTEYCPATGDRDNPSHLKYRYSILSMAAMAVHWLILIDLAVFSTEISAFLLVCGHVLAEVKQFLTALGYLLLTFGSAISILCRNCPDAGGDFSDMINAIVSLFAITVGLYQGDFRDTQHDRLLLGSVSLFVTISVVLLLNLLVAQLNRSYEYIYKDMLGFARLNRASLIVDAMESCNKYRWRRFTQSLNFDERMEFDEGDLGLPGGIATKEAASLHRQSRESIHRFGGTTSGLAPWPEDIKNAASTVEVPEENETERVDRLEKLVGRISKRVDHVYARIGMVGSAIEGESGAFGGSVSDSSD